jgi:RimJ/RimL family protein N-acetyltransferase
MRVRGDESREAFAAWFEAALRDYPFAILVGGIPVGSSSYLNVREDDGVVEIGNTWVASRAWGTGANTEAKYLLLANAFDAGYRRVEFKTEAVNERSRAALLGIGATFEGVFRKHMVVRGGERRDSAWYSVIDDEWPAVKGALEQKLRQT